MRIRRIAALAALTFVATGALSAQAPDPRAQRLRAQLEERFAERIQVELGLTDEQGRQVGPILQRHARERRQVEARERQMRAALGRQLRPGIAANSDSVSALLTGIAEARVRYAEIMREELQALSTVLTPVQRGQFYLMRDRILTRAQELIDQRPRGGQGPPPGGPRP